MNRFSYLTISISFLSLVISIYAQSEVDNPPHNIQTLIEQWRSDNIELRAAASKKILSVLNKLTPDEIKLIEETQNDFDIEVSYRALHIIDASKFISCIPQDLLLAFPEIPNIILADNEENVFQIIEKTERSVIKNNNSNYSRFFRTVLTHTKHPLIKAKAIKCLSELQDLHSLDVIISHIYDENKILSSSVKYALSKFHEHECIRFFINNKELFEAASSHDKPIKLKATDLIKKISGYAKDENGNLKKCAIEALAVLNAHEELTNIFGRFK